MTKKSNKVALTLSMLNNAPSLQEVFDLEAFRTNFIKNYELTSAKSNGDQVWEREKILMLKKISEDKNLQKCTRVSIYSSFVELALSGLTLQDDQAYIIPYKDVATFQVGWKGRLHQIGQLDQISEIGQPQVVYESDEFDYELGGLSAKVLKHKRTSSDHPEEDIITHVYLGYIQNGEQRFIVMERHEVLAIRDNYSKSYQYYASNNGIGKTRDGREFKIDPPMWVTSEAEAFKKTIVKRLYKNLPKTAIQKKLDKVLEVRPDVEEGETMDIDYGLIDDKSQPVTPEVVPDKDENDEF